MASKIDETMTEYQHAMSLFDAESIEETLHDLIGMRESIHKANAYRILEVVKHDAEKDLHVLDLLDRTIAYTLAKRDRDAEREMYE